MSNSNTWQDVSKRSPCTVCGHRNWCSRTLDGKALLCRRVNTGKGISKTDKNGDEFWLYFNDVDTGSKPPNPIEPPQDTGIIRADADTLNAVYSTLLDQLTLTKAHAINLAKRGLSTKAIKQRGYKSMRSKTRAGVAHKLADRFGIETLLTVPGFFLNRENGREWVSIAASGGLYIPIRDVKGRIIAIKIRLDDAEDRPKYLYLSSSNHGGSSPGAPVHVPLFDGNPGETRVTEGELKADIATELSGVLTIGIAGVSQYRLVPSILKSLGADKVSLALDYDVRSNRHVARSLQGLADVIASAGFVVSLEVWPEEAGKGIDDVLAGGFMPEKLTGQSAWKELSRIVLEAREIDPVPASQNKLQPEALRGMPSIKTNDRFLREITDDALAALDAANEPTPHNCVRGNALVRLRVNNIDVTAEPLNRFSLKGILDRSAKFVRVIMEDGQEIEKPSRPPDDVVSDILSLPKYDLPELRTIAGAPVLLPECRFLVNEGYDTGSGTYLYLNGLGGRVHHDWPLDRCLDIIFGDLLFDFPFADEGSRAHALALLLQPFLRPYIDGPTPMYLIDAPGRGTGKGLLADVIAIVTLGHPAWVMSQPRDEDEMRKQITASLMEGSPMILLDNVSRLYSGPLCAVLTTTQWKDRRLGQSKMVEVPNHATWLATGNNVSLSDEMLRRVVSIRIDSGVERPEDRNNFKHEDLLGWTREHRAELVSACLSIINVSVTQGMPRGTAALGRFESWAGVMGGIQEVAGVRGFLSNRDRLYTVADLQSEDWSAFCEAWYESYGEHPVTAKDLLEVAKNQNLLIDVLAGRSALAAQQRIGHALSSRRDRIFGRWKIRRAGRSSQTKNVAYRLEIFQEYVPGQNTRNTPYIQQNIYDTKGVDTDSDSVSGVSGVYSGSDPQPPAFDCRRCHSRKWRWEPDFAPPSWVCGNCEPT